MNYKSFIITDGLQWDAYIWKSLNCETYQTYCYHSLNIEGEPLLFVFEEGDLFIALPLIKRKIADSSFYDLTSVYGYGGPIANQKFGAITTETKAHFKNSFKSFMANERCISVFSRLHPFMDQLNLLEGLGTIKENGETIYMDLSRPLEIQRSAYEKRLARQIRSLRKKNYVLKEASTDAEVIAFTEMYNENMDRLKAASHYYFDHSYFLSLINMSSFNNKLMLIYDGKELICGALILLSKNIIRNHLSATAANYMNESPSKLLTDEISHIGRSLGINFFHLGGGVGGREDSLFKFKRYFSDQLLPDRLWCYVHDHDAYDELVRQQVNEINQESEFFPLYRYQPDGQQSTKNQTNGVVTTT